MRFSVNSVIFVVIIRNHLYNQWLTTIRTTEAQSAQMTKKKCWIPVTSERTPTNSEEPKKRSAPDVDGAGTDP